MKNSPAKYISCMKLNGLPILPPIITPEYRKELYRYQQEAIAIEKRLIETRIPFLNSISEKITSQEQTLAFNDNNEAFRLDNGVNRVPLTCDIQVSQYTNNQFEVILSDREELKPSIAQLDINRRLEDSNNGSIRRNSYTLDGPSPFLIDKFANIEINDTFNLRKCSTGSEKSTEQSEIIDSTNNCDINLYPYELRLLTIDDMKGELFVNTVNELDNEFIKNNLSSDTETELMNLSFHSSVESQINRSDGLNEDLTTIINPENVAEQNRELYKILTNVPTDYSAKLLTLLNVHGEQSAVKEPSLVDRTHWAASVIVAWSRGHLVRRLLRSAHVQRLVDTIRAALTCAVQLHGETEDRIEAADVELHRRLIQQVSAACCDFHDVFFELSLVERLRIIRLDRVAKRKQSESETRNRSADKMTVTAHGRVVALASRRQPLSVGGGTSTRRLFPPFSTVIQSI